jgi:16S rRNA processing protein RimM
MSDADRWLRAGVVGRPHGLDGSFHVVGAERSSFRLLIDDMEIRVGDESHRVVRVAGHAGGPILRLAGASVRADAEALSGQEIRIQRSSSELEDDEWWAEDLEGCAVRDGDEEVGVVSRLLGLPSCEVLEVARAAGGPALLVPLVTDAVREVDLERGVIDVDLRFLGER